MFFSQPTFQFSFKYFLLFNHFAFTKISKELKLQGETNPVSTMDVLS